MATTANASLRKSDQTQGGGGPKTATVSEIEFVGEFDYGGRQSKAQAALRVVFTIDGFQKPWEQHCTIGPAEAWEVVEGGDGIQRANGKAGGLNENSNAGRFFGALEDNVSGAMDMDDVLPDSTVRALRGALVTIDKLQYETVGGDTKEMFVITGIEALGGTKGKKAAGKTSNGGGNVDAATEAVILELFDGKPLKTKEVPNLISVAAKGNPNVRAMMQLAFKDVWLFDSKRPWDSDRKKMTITAKETGND